MREILEEMKVLIQTPMRLHDPENIPAQFNKVYGKVFTRIYDLHFSNRNDEDILKSFLSIGGYALAKNSFTEHQKENIRKWQEKITDIYARMPKVSKKTDFTL